MNIHDIITSVVSVLALAGPALTYHHLKIRTIIRTITEVAEALNGGPVNPEK